MIKSISVTAIAFALSLGTAAAQLIVEDPASIVQDAANQVDDFAKYVEMVNNQIQQINTMTQELQHVSAYVKAFGDPASLLNVTGAGNWIPEFQPSSVG